MALKTRYFETPTPENLRRLLVLRYFVIVGQALALLAAHAAFDWALPLGSVSLILIAMALLNLFTQRHLQSARLPTQRAVLG